VKLLLSGIKIQKRIGRLKVSESLITFLLLTICVHLILENHLFL